MATAITNKPLYTKHSHPKAYRLLNIILYYKICRCDFVDKRLLLETEKIRSYVPPDLEKSILRISEA